MHCYFANYEPKGIANHTEMVALIKQQQHVLSMFAQASGQRRCALGLDFADYDPHDGSVPVYLLGKQEMIALAAVEGKKIRKAFRSSRVGKNLVVTYSTPVGRGWFLMRFELGEFSVN